jgi:hypothetical protein
MDINGEPNPGLGKQSLEILATTYQVNLGKPIKIIDKHESSTSSCCSTVCFAMGAEAAIARDAQTGRILSGVVWG